MNVSFIHPGVSVRRSPTHGYGYYADGPLYKGEIIIVQGGRIVSEADLDAGSVDEHYACHAFQVERNLYMCPLRKSGIEESGKGDGIFLLNHSCDPNCGFLGQVTLVAIRDIAPDEQITFDYAMTDWGDSKLGWFEMKCSCGCADCRGIVSFVDWKLPEIQKKYAGYFSRYIQDAINAEAR